MAGNEDEGEDGEDEDEDGEGGGNGEGEGGEDGNGGGSVADVATDVTRTPPGVRQTGHIDTRAAHAVQKK